MFSSAPSGHRRWLPERRRVLQAQAFQTPELSQGLQMHVESAVKLALQAEQRMQATDALHTTVTRD